MEEDTLIELKVIQKDSESNPTTQTLPMQFTLGQLRDWIISELDGVPEPTWQV
tara:strand:- start:496 stop:654 length:159 start_codon:yes stop_codon:yes gene_type:complete